MVGPPHRCNRFVENLAKIGSAYNPQTDMASTLVEISSLSRPLLGISYRGTSFLLIVAIFGCNATYCCLTAEILTHNSFDFKMSRIYLFIL